VEYVDIYIFKIRLSVTIRYSCSIVLGGECRSASAALRLGAGNAKKTSGMRSPCARCFWEKN